MTTELDNQYIGNVLLKLGFSDWFRYLFRVIEGTPFIVEPIHNDLFDAFNRICELKAKRININIPPRSGKTTLAKWLCVYALTINPKSNIIYTSYSQSLVADIAASIKNILEHPIYKAMFPNQIIYEEETNKPIDDFWLEYLKKETGKNTYSTKKIITSKGGTCIFSSLGSQITGYGVGIRNCKTFCGLMVIDDANKPDDVYYEKLRYKVHRYYEETLLSRFNSDAPIVNIQQRLHIDDLSGFLQKNYKYETLKKPLLLNGVCQLPTQYNAERIKEIQTNELMFLSQYQQEPTEWINDAFKGVQWATDEETKLIYNGISHTDKGFDGSDGTAFTIGNEKNGIIYLFGKLWQKHIDDCLNDMSFFRQQYKSGTNYTEKNDDKGYMGRNYPNTAIYQETMNKHFKIMTYLYPNWKRIKFIKGTDEAYIKQIQGYSERANHDDAPDSASSLIRMLSNRTELKGMRPF